MSTEMTLIVQEVRAKSILSRSKIYRYVVNPYTCLLYTSPSPRDRG